MSFLDSKGTWHVLARHHRPILQSAVQGRASLELARVLLAVPLLPVLAATGGERAGYSSVLGPAAKPCSLVVPVLEALP